MRVALAADELTIDDLLNFLHNLYFSIIFLVIVYCVGLWWEINMSAIHETGLVSTIVGVVAIAAVLPHG